MSEPVASAPRVVRMVRFSPATLLLRLAGRLIGGSVAAAAGTEAPR